MTDQVTKNTAVPGPTGDPMADSILDLCSLLEAAGDHMPAFAGEKPKAVIANIRERFTLTDETPPADGEQVEE